MQYIAFECGDLISVRKLDKFPFKIIPRNGPLYFLCKDTLGGNNEKSQSKI